MSFRTGRRLENRHRDSVGCQLAGMWIGGSSGKSCEHDTDRIGGRVRPDEGTCRSGMTKGPCRTTRTAGGRADIEAESSRRQSRAIVVS